jgi:Plasmid pRiA4b ORF-3-like protein
MTSDSRSAQSNAAGSPKPSRGRGFGKPKDSGADLSPEEKEVIPRTPNQFYMFTFKVSLGEIWRRIAIGSDMQLSDLADLILDSVDFDRDHLDKFTYKDPLGRKQNVMHPSADGAIATTEMNVGALPIEPGGTLEYVFDFGDWWKFGLQLETVVPGRGEYQGEILEAYGDAPVQYPDWEE